MTVRYFDAHTHLNFVAYKDDRAEVVARAKEAEVGMNVVGTQIDTSKAAATLAEAHENVWATIGLHPIHTSKSYHDPMELDAANPPAGGFTSRGEVFDMQAYAELASRPKVIAIGECGLDYYRADESMKETQKKVFVQQIELANETGKALMLHIRNAYDDALEMLTAHAKVKGDVHFFAGDWATAKKFLDFGFTLSFTGVITFTHDYDEVIRNAPLDMLLSETDAPYVTPAPHRGKRNEPSYVPLVAETIARVRLADPEVVAARLLGNARRVFSL